MLALRAIVHYFCVCESAHIKLNARATLVIPHLTTLSSICQAFSVFVSMYACNV